jgi:AcrR family transcriptional regulator
VPTTVPQRPGRGRRPSAEVRALALAAAGDLLFEQGIDAVTHERVAARAGVSKTTLYKWWPTAGAMAAEAYFLRSEADLAMPDTGDLEADLVTQVRGFIRLVTTPGPGRAVRGILAAAQTDESVRTAFLERYVRPRRQVAVDAFTRAQQRGQMRTDVDFIALIDQIWGACYYRLLVEPDTVTPELGETLVRQALHGIFSATGATVDGDGQATNAGAGTTPRPGRSAARGQAGQRRR